MGPSEETFSKIVRSLLLDVDIHMDQLEQIGYLSKEQRQFLDRFLYKSQDALRAAAIVCSLHDQDLLISRLPSFERESETGIIPSSASSVNDTGSEIVAAQLKVEQDAFTNFLKRCDEHNFSVKVRDSGTGKESSVKAKGPEYILTLEPIAEDTSKAAIGNKAGQKAFDSKLPASADHDTKLMLYGAEDLTHDIDVESVDFETTLHTHDGINLGSNNIEQTVQQITVIESLGLNIHHSSTVDPEVPRVEFDIVELTNIPVRVDLPKVEPLNVAVSLSQPSTDHTAEIKLANAGCENDKKQALPGDQSDDAFSSEKETKEKTEEVETNAWGKRVKPDLTKNKEGTIVGGSAKPLGLNNKGRAMMEKMGWSKGTGLGKEKGGILEPITGVVKTSKAGLRSTEEKRHKPIIQPIVQPHTPASNNTGKSNSSEEDTLGSGLTVTDSSDGGKMSPNTDWENYSERLQCDAEWAAVKQHAEEIVRNKPPFKGIQALLIRNPEDLSSEKTIVFKAKIKGKKEYKSTRHYPGVVIKAKSPQPSDFLNQKNGFRIICGDHLEILRPHQGDQYHVFNFNQKKRGIVKIALVEMAEQPEASKVSVSSWTSTPPALATAWA